jgi:hypothetical protein
VGADDQQLGFEHFIADVEDSNVEFKQSQKVRLGSDRGCRLTSRTEHARNLIQRECRMLNYWNCRNDCLRIQRIGSSRRSRLVWISMASIMRKTWTLGGDPMEKTVHRRGERTGTYGKAHEAGRKEQQPDRHITTNYAQQANIVCIHNARQHSTTYIRD